MTAAGELVKLCEDAQGKLEEILRGKAVGSPEQYERRVLRQTAAVLQQLKRAAPEIARRMVLEGYQTGLESAAGDLATAGTPPASDFSAPIHREARNRIVQNTVDSLTKAINGMGRGMAEEIRAAAQETTGKTARDMQRNLEQRLLGPGLRRPGRMGVRYKNGRVVPLNQYAAMAARTATAEAQNRAKLAQAREWGCDLVRCTTHHPTCEVCAQYQGRVYALTREAANGTYKGPNNEPLHFPLLYGTALVRGYETIHPNCRHRFTLLPARAYTPAELAGMSRRSMRPFADARGDAERKAYAQEQAARRARNADLREWRSTRAALPEEAPASFAEFRRRKQRAGLQRDGALQADRRTILEKSAQSVILNDKEEAAVLAYISGGSYALNAKLREGIPLEPHEEETVRQLDGALKKLPVYRGEVVRALSFDTTEEVKRFAKKHPVGEIVSYPAFTSSSVRQGYAEHPTVIQRIRSVSGRDLRQYNAEEGEILFRRGTRFRITGVTCENGCFIMDLEEAE